MTPTRANDLIENVEKLNPDISPDDIHLVITDNWRELRKHLTTGENAWVFMPGLGKFKAIRSKVIRAIQKTTNATVSLAKINDVVANERDMRRIRLEAVLKDITSQFEVKNAISRQRKRIVYGLDYSALEEPEQDC